MLTGSEFQAAGPATANELSAIKRVLVRCTTKLPRADDRRRLSLQRLQIIGQINWRCAVKDIKHEEA